MSAHPDLAAENAELRARLAEAQKALEATRSGGVNAPEAGRLRGSGGAFTDITERLRAEAALHQSEERFRAFFHGAAVGAAEMGLDRRFLEVNESFCRITGYSREELLRMTPVELTHPEDRWREDEQMPAFLRGESQGYEAEKRYVRKDGQVIWVQVNAVMIRDASGQPLRSAGIVRNITPRKRAEEGLRESRAKLEAALASMTDAVFISDAQGRFIHLNDAFATFHRFKSKDECLQTLAEYPDILEVFMADGTAAPLEKWPVPRALRGETVTNAEYKLRRKDTGQTWVGSYSFGPIRNKDGGIVGSVVAARDITEQKRLSDALRFVGERAGGPAAEDFFQALARYLAQNLGADFVCIDQLEEGSLAAQTLSIFYEGKFQDNLRYTLKDTPCGDVVGQQVCCFPRNVRGLFPKDTVLQEMRAEGYLGTTLWNAQGRPIGLIALIWRQPLADTRQASAILQLVAVRAAGELERRQSEAALRESEARAKVDQAVKFERQRLQEVLDKLPAYVLLLTPDYHMPFANRFFEERFGKPEGRHCYEHLFQRDKPCEDCHSFKVLQTHASQQWEWTGPDSRNYDVHDFPFTDVDGSPLIMEVGLDITQRKQAQAELAKHREHLQELVRERTAELSATNAELLRFNEAMVGRELRMIELKQEINALCAKLAQPPRYPFQAEAQPPESPQMSKDEHR
jgi:PAS domain S-box-containing protein